MNDHIPPALVDRLLSVLEDIAINLERIAEALQIDGYIFQDGQEPIHQGRGDMVVHHKSPSKLRILG